MANAIEAYAIKLILLFIVLYTLAVFAVVFIISALQADNMRQLGYEAKNINLTCYAKAQGQWHNCDWAIHLKP